MLKRFTLNSSLIPDPVEICVILPPSYDESSDHRYPLLLWLHPADSSCDLLSEHEALFRRLWQANRMDEMIIATPSTGLSFYMDWQGGAVCWETFLRQQLVKYLRNQFCTNEYCHVGGIAMGGLGALRLGLKFPNEFASVLALEPTVDAALHWSEVKLADRFFYDEKQLFKFFGDPIDTNYWALNNPASIVRNQSTLLLDSELLIYLEVGSEDDLGLHKGAEFLHRCLFDRHVKHEYRYVLGAGHVGSSLPGRIMDAMNFLKKNMAPASQDPQRDQFKNYVNELKTKYGLD